MVETNASSSSLSDSESSAFNVLKTDNLCQSCRRIDFNALFDKSNSILVNANSDVANQNIPFEKLVLIDSFANITQRAVHGCNLCSLFSNVAVHRYRWVGGEYESQEKARGDISNWNIYLVNHGRDNHADESLLTVFLSPTSNEQTLTYRDLFDTRPHLSWIHQLNGSTDSNQGRIIPTRIDINVLKSWLGNCETSHPGCHLGPLQYLAHLRETREANIKTSDTSQLVSTSSDNPPGVPQYSDADSSVLHMTVKITDSKQRPKKFRAKFPFHFRQHKKKPPQLPHLQVELVTRQDSNEVELSQENGLKETVNQHLRLIDVSRRCILSREHFPANPRYAILSFVWGLSIQGCSLTKVNLNKHIDDLGRICSKVPDILPTTLQDAINLTARIDIEYLWIDCLCIVQDDTTDKISQINNMGSIYQSATVCIVGAAGCDANAGLPGVNKARNSDAQNPVRLENGKFIGITQIGSDELLRSTKWITRGWTYQELLLSKRILIFTDHEVLYQCGHLHHRESVYENWEKPQSTRADMSGPISFQIYASYGRRKMDTAPRPYISLESYLSEYSKRVLTFDSDAINAFIGVGRILEYHAASPIIFGLLEKTFMVGMLWAPFRSLRRRIEIDGHDGKSRPLFPSWTWAAWEGHVLYIAHALPSWNLDTMINIPKPMLYSGLPATGFETLFASELTSDGSQRSLVGIIPTITRIATFDTVQRLETIGKGVRTQYEIYSAPAEGILSRQIGTFTIGSNQESTIPSRATFMQLFVKQDYSTWGIVLGHCSVLMIDSTEMELALSNTDVTRVAETFHQMEVDSQGMTSSSIYRPSDLPCQGLHIDRHAKISALKRNKALMASRIGIGSIELDAWRDVKPESALVLLG